MNQMPHNAQKPKSVLYKLYETNADLEQVALVFSGYHKDIAETVLWKVFKAADYEKDFYIIDSNTWEIVSMIFSARTSKLRGECQG